MFNDTPASMMLAGTKMSAVRSSSRMSSSPAMATPSLSPSGTTTGVPSMSGDSWNGSGDSAAGSVQVFP